MRHGQQFGQTDPVALEGEADQEKPISSACPSSSSSPQWKPDPSLSPVDSTTELNWLERGFIIDKGKEEGKGEGGRGERRKMCKS